MKILADFKIPSQSEWHDFTSRGKDTGLLASAAAIVLAFISPSLENEAIKYTALAVIFWGGILRHVHSRICLQATPSAMLQLVSILVTNALAWAVFLWPYIMASDGAAPHYQIFGFVIMSGVLTSVSQAFVSQGLIFYGYSMVLVAPAVFSAIEGVSSGRAPYIAFYLSFFFVFLAKQRSVFIDQWRALEKSKQDLQSLISNFPGAISLVRKGKYIYANSEVAKIAGLPIEKIVEQTVGFNHPEAAIPKLIHEMEAQKVYSILNREVSLASPSGPQEHLVFLNRLQNEDIVCVSLNISSQRALERELVHQKTRAQHSAKMAALGEMSGGLSHEINNPLAVIMGNNHRIKQILTRKPIDEAAILKLSDSTTKVIERIAKIVKGLKNFARDGNQDPFAPSNLSEIVTDTLAFCETRMENYSIRFTKIGFDKKINIDCRSVQISQVVLNLLNNAHDALEHAREKWIEVELVDKGETAQIIIRDSGPGVKKDVREKLMQPFFTTKEVGKGTGLGLSISKGLIEDHHGKIYFDYEQLHTTVVIEVPKKQPATKLLSDLKAKAA